MPKVGARDGEPVSFRSALVPPYVRKTKSLEAALPWLYLKGVSTGEMSDAQKAQPKGQAGRAIGKIAKLCAVEKRHKQSDGPMLQLAREEAESALSTNSDLVLASNDSGGGSSDLLLFFLLSSCIVGRISVMKKPEHNRL